jgi:isoleucyl-tRNA synthetase
LSSFYLDVLKDRMYTFAPSSHARRSAQTVLWQITEALVRLVTPILSFTADEVWEHLPAVEGREASVHLAQFPAPAEIFSEDPAPLLKEWKYIFAVRDAAMVKLEEARQEKRIGKGLEAELEIAAAGELHALLNRHAAGLKEILNVSAVKAVKETEADNDLKVLLDDVLILVDNSVGSLSNYSIKVSPATGHKCARCWNFMPEVSDYGIWQNVCNRCQSALTEMGIQPPQPQSTEAAS